MLCGFFVLLLADARIVTLLEQEANARLRDPQQQVRVLQIQTPPDLPPDWHDRPIRVTFSEDETFDGVSTVHLQLSSGERWLTVRFQRMVPAPVAQRALSRGEALSRSEVVIKPVPWSALGGQPPPTLEQLEGSQLLVPVRAGQPLRRQWLARSLVIRQGETVQLEVRLNGVLVRTTVQALSAGRPGDVIAVKNPESGRRLQAEVAGPGLVRLMIQGGIRP